MAWVAEKSSDAGYQAIAKLRISAILIEGKKFDDALSQLNGTFPVGFEALVADRKGDVFVLKGDKAQAVAEYEKAYRLLDVRSDYRRLVEVKLNAQGVDVSGRDPVATPAGK